MTAGEEQMTKSRYADAPPYTLSASTLLAAADEGFLACLGLDSVSVVCSNRGLILSLSEKYYEALQNNFHLIFYSSIK